MNEVPFMDKPMNQNNNQKFLDVAVKAARKAGEYQKSRWQTNFKIEYKSSINLVTEVDKQCEEMIISTILEIFPDHDLMAEEGSGNRKDSPYKWVIDPLD